jgi:hypothetical protein
MGPSSFRIALSRVSTKRVLLPSHWEGTEGRAWNERHRGLFVGGVNKHINSQQLNVDPTHRIRLFIQVASPLPNPLPMGEGGNFGFSTLQTGLFVQSPLPRVSGMSRLRKFLKLPVLFTRHRCPLYGTGRS